jgi:hypothetical protein
MLNISSITFLLSHLWSAVEIIAKYQIFMFAGLVRSRDGSRDDTGTHFMNLPSPNVQSEVITKSLIYSNLVLILSRVCVCDYRQGSG